MNHSRLILSLLLATALVEAKAQLVGQSAIGC